MVGIWWAFFVESGLYLPICEKNDRIKIAYEKQTYTQQTSFNSILWMGRVIQNFFMLFSLRVSNVGQKNMNKFEFCY